MNNRFRFSSTKKNASPFRDLIIPTLFFIGIIAFFYFGINDLTLGADHERLRSAQQSVAKAAVQCYALEGQYPATIDYLRDHYGLSIDEKKYLVHYEVFASNIMPQITVLPRDF